MVLPDRRGGSNVLVIRLYVHQIWSNMYMHVVHRWANSCTMKYMKTHIELDDDLLEQVFQLGGFATKKAAVNTALAEYAKLLKRRELLAMRGQVRWEGDLAALRADRVGRKP